MSNLLRISNLNVSSKKTGVFLVNDVSLSLSSGKSLIILGQSGSGKTTICNTIFNLISRKNLKLSGEIFYKNENLIDNSKKNIRNIYGSEISLIPQNPMTAFNPSVKLGKQMLETLKKKIILSMEELGLKDSKRIYNSYPYQLSGGMLQRATIAMAFVLESKLIIADEATGSH